MKRRLSIALVLGALLALPALSATPAAALSVNNLSFPGTMGEIRIRPVLQLTTGATVLQTGDQNNPATNPNRTVGDYVIPLSFNSGGLRVLGNNPSPPSGHAGHTHYHAGDTQILVNDARGFAVGDTILIGSPYCNLAYLGNDCQGPTGNGFVNEQPAGQVAYIIGGDAGFPGPAVMQILPLQYDSPQCFTPSFGSCAFVEGQQIVKLPTLYQGQQFRVDIPHAGVVNGSPNDVVVTANFYPPSAVRNPSHPARPLPLDRDNPLDFDVQIDNACGAASPPPSCGAGFVSFYIPKEITGTATRGTTFSYDNGDDWYAVEVIARDAATGQIRADGVARFKLNPVAIYEFAPDRSQVFVGESVNLRGKLRDASSAAALVRRPAEDVIVDVEVVKPSGASSRYQVTSCADVNPSPTNDTCGGDPVGSQPNNHGSFQVRVGGLQGFSIRLPGLQTTLNCRGYVDPFDPSTYGNLFDIPGCVTAPVLSLFDTLETGTYQATATLRGYIPLVSRSTTFDVVI